MPTLLRDVGMAPDWIKSNFQLSTYTLIEGARDGGFVESIGSRIVAFGA